MRSPLPCAIMTLIIQLEAPPAEATEIRTEVGLQAAGTEWRGDVAGYAHLAVGVRPLDYLGFYVRGDVGYAAVDTRMLTLLSLGVQGWTPMLGPVRLFGRVGFIHQHEESWSVVAGDVGRALLGLGDGIRHRGGVGTGLGVEVPFFEKRDFTWFAKVDGTANIFPDPLGPRVYGGGGVGLGFDYAL